MKSSIKIPLHNKIIFTITLSQYWKHLYDNATPQSKNTYKKWRLSKPSADAKSKQVKTPFDEPGSQTNSHNLTARNELYTIAELDLRYYHVLVRFDS